MATGKNEILDGIEEEELYCGPNEETKAEPFDPKYVDIVSEPMVVSNVVEQLKYNDILLEPDFQRHPDLWNPGQQSRLIESLIIRIPLPTFYFDRLEDDKLIVVDGLQRLYTLKRFMALEEDDPNRLILTELEYLKEYEGKKFEQLPPIILIENPESHLHPKGQAMMGKLIALAAEHGCQILCESHSDHVINGVRVAIKNGTIKNEKVEISFFSKNKEQETKVDNIFVDRKGNLSDYPSGLLDEWGILMAELM